MATAKRTVCIDVDGTLLEYDGFRGEEVLGKPLPSAAEATKQLKEDGWTIIIFTTRGNTDFIANYLKEHDIVFDHINENPNNPKGSNMGKPIAEVYVDDRGLTFTGSWEGMANKINNFVSWCDSSEESWDDDVEEIADNVE